MLNVSFFFFFFWNAWKISFVKSHSRGTFSYRGGVLRLKKEGKEKKKRIAFSMSENQYWK